MPRVSDYTFPYRIVFPEQCSSIYQASDSPRLIFPLRGGFGNQLFIYFAGQYALSKLGCEVLYDSRGVDHGNNLAELGLPGVFLGFRYFHRNQSYAYSLKRRLMLTKVKTLQLSEKVTLERNESYVVPGFHQSKNFIESLMKDGLRFDLDYSKIKQEIYQILQELNSAPSILLHVRGGDYLRHSESIGVLSPHYYESIISTISNREKHKIFVLTDDFNFATSFFESTSIKIHKYIAANNQINNLQYLAIFQSANHVILANSTYSWWGAFLARSKNVVYAPDPWFRQSEFERSIYPQDWVLIKSLWLSSHENSQIIASQ